MTRTWRVVLLVVVACLAGGSLFEAGRLSNPPSPNQSAGPAHHQGTPGLVTMNQEAQAGIGLTVVPVLRREVDKRLPATGRIAADPSRSAQLRPLGPGRATSVLCRLGDHVSRGQTLVRYRDASLLATDVQLVDGRASLAQAQSNQVVAAAALARGRALLGGVVAQAELDRRRAALTQANAAVAVARGQLGSLRQRRLLYAVTPGPPGEAAIIAPSDGYVTSLEVAPGDMLDPARVVATVSDLSTVGIVFSVYQENIQHVARNGEVPFTVDALPKRHFSASITASDALLDPVTGVMQMRCSVANPNLRFRPGMLVEGDLPTNQTADALTLPAAALQDIDGAPVVFVQTGTTQFRQQRIHIGLQTRDLIEVTDGLREGQSVVANGSFWLKSQALQAELGDGS